jgi:phage baseplate assembly protein V
VDTKDRETVVYPDGSTVDYNSATNTLTVTVSGTGNVVVNCKTATVNAETKVELATPLVHATGDIHADGDVVAGSISLKTHVHGGVQSGGSNTSGPS